jgi:hypothetical protein
MARDRELSKKHWIQRLPSVLFGIVCALIAGASIFGASLSFIVGALALGAFLNAYPDQTENWPVLLFVFFVILGCILPILVLRRVTRNSKVIPANVDPAAVLKGSAEVSVSQASTKSPNKDGPPGNVQHLAITTSTATDCISIKEENALSTMAEPQTTFPETHTEPKKQPREAEVNFRMSDIVSNDVREFLETAERTEHIGSPKRQAGNGPSIEESAFVETGPVQTATTSIAPGSVTPASSVRKRTSRSRNIRYSSFDRSISPGISRFVWAVLIICGLSWLNYRILGFFPTTGEQLTAFMFWGAVMFGPVVLPIAALIYFSNLLGRISKAADTINRDAEHQERGRES